MEPASLPAWSRELYQEGLIIPPVRLTDEVVALFLANARNPRERRGDLRAQMAAHRLAERRIDELCARRGPERVAAAMDELYAYSERLVRAAIARLPDGRWSAEDVVEAVEGDVLIRCTVEVRGDEIRVDFAGTAPHALRQPQLPARGDALGVLLRRAVSRRPRRSCLRRRLRAGHGARTRRVARQRASPGRGRNAGRHQPLGRPNPAV